MKMTVSEQSCLYMDMLGEPLSIEWNHNEMNSEALFAAAAARRQSADDNDGTMRPCDTSHASVH